MINNYKNKVIFAVIILLACILRFYDLGAVPRGLNTDETAIGYNAYSILQTGKDEHGEVMPLYFKSFGDFKLPVYIYATAGIIKLIGPSEVAVRFTSFLLGVITVIAIYYLVLILSKNEKFALLASFLLAINPWHIFFSRVGFEVNVAIALITLGVLSFIYSTKMKKYNSVFLIISVLLFLLSLYSYNVTRILSPVLIFSLLVLYRNSLSSISRNYIILAITLFLAGMVPFFVTLSGGPGLESQRSVLLIGGEKLAQNIEFRSYATVLPEYISKLFFNNWFLVGWNYLKNIVSFFSVDFFFVNGASHPINGVGNFGMFHLIEVIFIPIGIFVGIKKKIRFLYPFYIWMGIVILLAGITKEIPHPTRMYGITIPFIIFSAYGLTQILSYVAKDTFMKRTSFILLTAFFSYSMMFYLTTYYNAFPIKYARAWRSEDKILTQYIKSEQSKYQRIIVDDSATYAYTSLLFYSEYAPDKIHTSGKFGSQGLLTTLKSVENIEFRKINWEEDMKSSKTLFITLENKPDNITPKKIFYFPTKPLVLFYDNKIDRFPATDVAYILYESSR